MSGYVDRENTRADYTRIHGLKTDENGVVLVGPSLYSLSSTLKNFEYVSSVCDECSTDEEPVVAWVDEVGEDVCPECGMVCVAREPISFADPTFETNRGGSDPTGPSLAPVPFPQDETDTSLYTMGDAEL
ncbi:Zn finger [Halorubrum tailed virus 27]|uniref:Zn finger n=1 Tax=Halorubrum tailed virus 27 TaxID=2878008 RepID=A0AAE8Y174_9CAUD|nr:Zn finger [Halorubrum tailed virus 27]UBF22753.1 Zn finger [Halorubrum tailed virus 27]